MWSPGSAWATRGSGSMPCMAAPPSCPSIPMGRAGRASSSASPVGGPMPRALVVDDEPLARERIRTLLRGHPGVEVAGECGDGVEALAAVRRERPHLLLLDVQMPGL